MYPFLRLAFNLWAARKLPPMTPLELHVSQHRCRLVDCDIFAEMNNGRILTMYEMGRFQAAVRMGLWALLKERRWGLTVAGTSIRYRRRITPFEKYETRTKIATWDDRFVYIEQGMFKKNGECASNVLLRTAVVEKGRAVPTARLIEALDITDPRPEPAAWVQNWIDAEATRLWPPDLGQDGPKPQPRESAPRT
ncbi:acyl-CoA thioesterase [Thalassorhabdomicrobium marinisediminis]|uniref:Thioeseterase n=1 Tax=Thalassorhabdomicrobium marinisediminis TaxID=2170577 RepID=A0A2T7FVR3_9RHOB|nr:acyl-CoA thioesterase [Thalassorhabdomicrobium marinisediminis]PVA06229.1 thioeseterase [Thalassorhabdomicrobium marinisediminis]